MTKDPISALYDLFADLLEYPTLVTSLKAGHCYERLQQVRPDVAPFLESFYHVMEQQTLEKMQELYTVTFDMQPVCYPYLGYQLFGESYKRGAFMAQLNETYHTAGYSTEQELPDHIAVVLHFIGLNSDNRHGDFCLSLQNEGLIPALEKMLKTFGGKSENPYFGLLSALQLFLVQTPEKELGHA
jgi:nitrate reductase delta subunit